MMHNLHLLQRRLRGEPSAAVRPLLLLSLAGVLAGLAILLLR
jgi:hypothetical protein